MMKLVRAYLHISVANALQYVRNTYFTGTELCHRSLKVKRLNMQKSNISVNIYFTFLPIPAKNTC